MGGEFEAAGAMATAGLVAGAIEKGEPGEAKEGACLNCGAQVSGRYCSNCGQAAQSHRSLWHVVEELLRNVYNFDTKTWRTLPMVVFRPGTLTRNFVFGKRARYISPLTAFLLCFFFMFFAFSLLPNPAEVQLDSPGSRAEAQSDLNEARDGLAEAERELAAERREAQGDTSPGSQVGVDVAEHAVARARADVERRQAALTRAEEKERQGDAQGAATDANTPARTAPPTAPAAVQPATDEPPATQAPTETGAAQQTPATPQPPATIANPYKEGSLDYWMYEASQSGNFTVNGKTSGPEFERIRAKLSNPPLLRYELVEAASKFSFLLIPISLPFIGFMFLFKKNITLYDHAVYALYALSFASLLLVLAIGAGQVKWLQWVPGVAIGIGLPIHTYFHLKGAYALKWWSALWRTVLMLFFAIIALCLWVAIILIVGFLG